MVAASPQGRRPAFIGVDVGTSAAKALLVDEDGKVLAQAEAAYPLYRPHPGWAEQDPEDWVRATCACLRQLADSVPQVKVRALSLSGQMHGAVLVDEAGRVIRPAILWCDVRTAPQCQAITALVGRAELLHRTGNPALEGFTAPKLVWLREHEPEHLRQARWLLLPKDYVRYRLTGQAATDASDAAGTLLFDVAHSQWDVDLARRLGLNPQILPPLLRSDQQAGQLQEQAAAATGWPAGLPVVMGGADNACGAVGAGVVTAGQGLASLGSSGVVLVQTDDFRVDPGGRIHSFRHAVHGSWYLMGVMLSAGQSYAWVRDQVGRVEAEAARWAGRSAYALLDEEAAHVPAGSDGLFFLPYLNGERTPHADAQARGGWIGLTATHGRGHLMRAVLEGVAYGMRDSLELIRSLLAAGAAAAPSQPGEPQCLRVIGGGAKSPLWRQILADVLGVALEVPAVDEGPAYGAALLAAVGSGAFPAVPEAAAHWVGVRGTVTPNAATQPQYQHGYEVYRQLYPALASLFPQMSAAT